MVHIEVEVDGVERTIRAIKRDLHRGMERSVDTLVDNAKDRAREVIQQENAIFNAEVYSGFRDAETGNSPTSVSAKLYNDVEHAEALEDGAEYTSEGPPVEALLPWVVRKMSWSSSNDYDFGDDYVPDTFRDDDSDDGDGDGDDDSGGSSPSESSESDPITNRFDGPLTERNEFSEGPDDEDKPLDERIDDYEHTFTEDFDKDSPDTYTRSQRVAYSRPNADRDHDTADIERVDEITEDYIELDKLFSNYRYYFPHVTEDEKEQYDQEERRDVEEVEILAIDERTPIEELQPDDRIIIDGDEADVDEWDGKEVYATVDEVGYYSEDEPLTVHAKYSSSQVEVPAEAYTVADTDTDAPWTYDGATVGSQVTFYDDIYDEIRTGYLQQEPSRGYNAKQWETPSARIAIPESGKSTRVDAGEVISIDESTDYFENNSHPVPENDVLSDELIEDIPDTLDGFEEGQRYRVWNHREGEFFDGEVAIVHSNHAVISPDGNTLSEFEYYPDRSYASDSALHVTPVGKYTDADGWDAGYPEIDQKNQLWYGQEVTYQDGDEEKTGIVSDWDERWVYLAETDRDRVPRIPTVETDTRLTDGEDWSEVVPEEKRAQQLYSEFRYRVNHAVDDEELVEDFAQFIRDDYFEWIRDDEVAQHTLSHMGTFTTPSRVGVGGAMSPGGGYEKYHYNLKVKPETDDDRNYDSFNKLTAFHEMQHALLYSHRLRHDGMEIAEGFTGKDPLAPGPFDEWPEVRFASDGSPITDAFDEIAIDDHGPIQDYIIKNQVTDEHFGRTDFSDIIGEIPQDDLDPSSLSDSDFDTSVTGPELFDESDVGITSNDVIRIRNGEGDTHIGVYASAGTKEETYWKFIDSEDNSIKVHADADGTITEIENGADDYSSDFEWELDGYYESQTDALDEPITDWMPSTDDSLEQFVTAGNRSLRKMLWLIQGDDSPNRQISNRAVILRGYAASNAHESIAGLTTVMQSPSYKHAVLLPQIYHHHPYLVKSYLDLYEPSELAREMLEDLNDPELNKYL